MTHRCNEVVSAWSVDHVGVRQTLICGCEIKLRFHASCELVTETLDFLLLVLAGHALYKLLFNRPVFPDLLLVVSGPPKLNFSELPNAIHVA